MIPRLDKKDVETLGALVLMHKQKVMDYTRAVPNVGMAKRHGQFVETLLKVQTVAGGEVPDCQGCVREGKDDSGCNTCSRHSDLTDNFKRRKT